MDLRIFLKYYKDYDLAQYYKVSLNDLMSRSRKQSLVRPRQMAIYLARQYTDNPLETIGKPSALLAGDLGCLMNMAGGLSREGRSDIRVFHPAEGLVD